MNFKIVLLDHFQQTWKKYLICLIIGLTVTVLSIYTSGGFSYLVSYVNGTFSAGFVLLCLGGLSVVSYLGAFDMFSYAFSKKSTKKEGYYNYSIKNKESKKNKRYNYIPYLVVSSLFILAAIIIRLFL